MRYNQIRETDIANGQGIGIALFVQGCHFHCKNCFNKETWDFNGGKEWNNDIQNEFLNLIKRPYIKRISILGGEPLAKENVEDVLNLICKIKQIYPQKIIWLYTGYKWEECKPFNEKKDDILKPSEFMPNLQNHLNKVFQLVSQCDVLIDGRYINSKKDITLKFCGSTNQRVIDVKKTIEKGEIVLWKE